MRMRHTQFTEIEEKLAILLVLGFFKPTPYFSVNFCSGLHIMPLYWKFTLHTSAGREARCSGSHSTSGLCQGPVVNQTIVLIFFCPCLLCFYISSGIKHKK